MRLDAWLRQDPSVVERLQLVERLAQAVNAAHDRGELLGALEPSRIDVTGDGECDLDDALRGTPAAEYRAPEREGSTPPSAAADVYAAGAIVWEVLVRRPYAAAPSHLSEARPDLPGDLADGVMACLERSPEWRPRDLAYVAQLAQQAAAQRGGAARASRPAKAAAAPRAERAKKSAGKPTARPSPEQRAATDDGRSPRLLLIAAGLLVAVAAGGYFWMTRGSGSESAAAPRPIAPAPAPTEAPAAEPSATPGLVPTPDLTAPAAPAPTAPTPTAPTPTAPTTPKPTPPPATADVPASAALSRPPAAEPAPAAPASVAAPTTSTPADAPPAAAATAPAAPAVAPPRERAELSTLSPLSVKRPGRVLFDLHGTGLAADLQARFIAVRDAPRGLSVVRQKCSGTLCNVLVELDGSVKPAAYAIVLEDPQGRQTNALTFTVTR